MNSGDPHQIYDDYLYLFEKFYGIQCKYIKRKWSRPSGSIYMLDALRVLFSDVINVLAAIQHPLTVRPIVREFSAKTLVLVWPLVILLGNRVTFNINHNLNSPLERLVISLLSHFTRFSLIGSGPDLRSSFPHIHHIPFVSRGGSIPVPSGDSIFLFVGSRPEQKIHDLTARIDAIYKIAERGKLRVVVVGGNAPKGLPNSVQAVRYLDNVRASVEGKLAVLLYNSANYTTRHSGILWTLCEFASYIIAPYTDMIEGTLAARETTVQLFHENSWKQFESAVETGVSQFRRASCV